MVIRVRIQCLDETFHLKSELELDVWDLHRLIYRECFPTKEIFNDDECWLRLGNGSLVPFGSLPKNYKFDNHHVVYEVEYQIETEKVHVGWIKFVGFVGVALTLALTTMRFLCSVFEKNGAE